MSGSPLDMLPIKRLKARKTGGEMVEVLVDGDYDGEYLSQFKWRVTPAGEVYTVILRDGTTPRKMKYIHQFVLPPKKGYWIHHINGNKLDNRSVNLEYEKPRDMILKYRTQSPGARPKNPNLKSYSKYRGVVRDAGTKTLPAYQAKCAGEYLGVYTSEERAARVYDRAAKKRWGDRAILNFPEEVKHE